jgi:hypothetical protein
MKYDNIKEVFHTSEDAKANQKLKAGFIVLDIRSNRIETKEGEKINGFCYVMGKKRAE